MYVIRIIFVKKDYSKRKAESVDYTEGNPFGSEVSRSDLRLIQASKIVN